MCSLKIADNIENTSVKQYKKIKTKLEKNMTWEGKITILGVNVRQVPIDTEKTPTNNKTK